MSDKTNSAGGVTVETITDGVLLVVGQPRLKKGERGTLAPDVAEHLVRMGLVKIVEEK